MCAGVALPASGSHANGAGRWLTWGQCGNGGGGRRLQGGWRGMLAGQFAVYQLQHPRGPGFVAARVVEAGEGVLGDSAVVRARPHASRLSYRGVLSYSRGSGCDTCSAGCERGGCWQVQRVEITVTSVAADGTVRQAIVACGAGH